MPSFCVESSPRAAKPHRCTVCRFTIQKELRHVAICGKWDGQVSTVRFHDECYEAYCLIAADYYSDGDCIGFEETVEAINERSRDGSRDENLMNARKALADAYRKYRHATAESRVAK